MTKSLAVTPEKIEHGERGPPAVPSAAKIEPAPPAEIKRCQRRRKRGRFGLSVFFLFDIYADVEAEWEE